MGEADNLGEEATQHTNKLNFAGGGTETAYLQFDFGDHIVTDGQPWGGLYHTHHDTDVDLIVKAGRHDSDDVYDWWKQRVDDHMTPSKELGNFAFEVGISSAHTSKEPLTTYIMQSGVEGDIIKTKNKWYLGFSSDENVDVHIADNGWVYLEPADREWWFDIPDEGDYDSVNVHSPWD